MKAKALILFLAVMLVLGAAPILIAGPHGAKGPCTMGVHSDALRHVDQQILQSRRFWILAADPAFGTTRIVCCLLALIAKHTHVSILLSCAFRRSRAEAPTHFVPEGMCF